MGSGIEETLRKWRSCSISGSIDLDSEPAGELDLACNDHMSELSALSKSDGVDCKAVIATDVSRTKHETFTSDGNDIITLEASSSLSLITSVCNLKKKLLILDLNGLLVDVVSHCPKDCKADIRIGRQAIFRRPFCLDFLNFCFERFEVGIWSSRMKKNIDRIIDYLMGDMKHKLLFCWTDQELQVHHRSLQLHLNVQSQNLALTLSPKFHDISQCTRTHFNTLENKHKPLVFKELKRIWEKEDPKLPWERGYYNESNTLLLDDSPYKALLNPAYTAIFPFPYQFRNKNDNSLGNEGDIRVYLEELAGADNVQSFVQKHPFGQKGVTENCISWSFYFRVLNSLA